MWAARVAKPSVASHDKGGIAVVTLAPLPVRTPVTNISVIRSIGASTIAASPRVRSTTRTGPIAASRASHVSQSPTTAAIGTTAVRG
jgi:hypothetical protein